MGNSKFDGVVLMKSFSVEKDSLRRKIWSLMEEGGISRFPKPVLGRIPNFVGAEIAAARLVEEEEYRRARIVKVNPDAPQHTVRLKVLLDGKMLLVPTPRLREGFMVLDPDGIPRGSYAEASTIRGSFKHGRPCRLDELPRVDMVVDGSVAISEDGVRIGKGGGYSELEYAILREVGAVGDDTPVFTTVHDVQIVDHVPKEPHDLTVDAIMTPTRTIRVKRRYERPKGILWGKISQDQLRNIPVLLALRKAGVPLG